MIRTARQFPHLIAGLWFALTGLIPAAFYLLVEFRDSVFERLNSYVITFDVLIPLLITAVYGSVLGAKIIKGYTWGKSVESGLRGFFIAALSFVSYVLVLTLTFPDGQTLEGYISLFLIGLFFAVIIVGWLAGITGAVAGWLLYKLFQFSGEEYQ